MKKYTLFIAVFVFFTLSLSAQDWVSMMKDNTKNVHDVENAFNRWYSQHKNDPKAASSSLQNDGDEEEENGNYMMFKRWQWDAMRHADPQGNRPDPATIVNDYRLFQTQSQHMRVHPNTPSPTGNWSYAGNTSVPTNGGAGRVNRLRFKPGNTNTLYACAPVGGLWVSTNGGASWSTSTDQIADLATSDVAIDPTNTNIMYLATGDGDGYPSIYPTTATVGVLKSTDGGVTWAATGLAYALSVAGANYYTVNELQINPNNTNIIIAATSFGIYYSSNAGATFTLEQNGDFKSLELEPSHPAIVYAATANALFYRSTNGGTTWTNITSGLPNGGSAGRFEIGVTPADTTCVYLLADNVGNYGYLGLYRSLNHGVSFVTQSTTPNLLGWACAGNDVGGQGWYTLPLGVSPTHRDSVMVGGVNGWMSSNGGTSWTLRTEWTGSCTSYIHADIHSIIYDPTSPKRIIATCDGGVFQTTNGGTSWTDLSSNLEIAQQYSIGPSQTVTGKWTTGWQDNGVNMSQPSWAEVLGGDGMITFIDWSNANTLYGENYQGDFQKSTNNGGSWNLITTNITEGGAWVTPWLQDPRTSATLYGGFVNVWKSTNGGTNWSKISTWGSSNIQTIAVDSLNNQYIYAAQPNMIQVTTNGGTSWTNISAGLPTGSANISCITINTKDPKHVWVSFYGYSSGNKVFESKNAGTSWTNVSGGLPNLPVNTIAYESGTGEGIYAGTDQGVYYRDTILGTFSAFSNGLPNVQIGDLKVYHPNNTLIAATFGRGTWTTPLHTACTPPTVTISSITNVKCNGAATGSATASPSGGAPPYTYTWSPLGGTSATAAGLSAGTYTVFVTDNAGCSATASATITQPATAVSVSTGSIVNVKCNGGATGSATATPSGGTPGYTYLWAPGGQTNATATGLAAASYTVTVTDANSCTATATAVITQPPPLIVNTSSTNATCGNGNGTTTATPIGGVSPYTFVWAPGGQTNATATGLSAATYTVTVTDANNCTKTASVAVTAVGGETVSINTVTNVKCNGGNNGQITTNTVGGTTPYTYNWTPSGGTNSTASNLTAGTYTITCQDANGCVSTASATVTQPAVLAPNTSTNPATCGSSNGSATSTPSGGTSPYTYAWAPGGQTNATATGLSAGTYTVTVTDANSCTATATAVVSNTGGETVSINTVTNVNCNGGNNGKITTNTVGGTTPYTYAWTPSGGTNSFASNLTAGTYTVTVHDANGCVSTASATITQPAVLTVSTGSISNVSCNGGSNGSATATPGGGTSPYTYAWAPGGQTNATATGLSAGTYTVTVTDANSCTATATAVITQPAVALSVSTGSIVNVKCNGGSTGSATATPAGGTSPYTYAWAPGGQTNATATGLSAGTYTITVTDANSCTATATAVITQPAVLTVGTSTTPANCGASNGSATATPGGGTSPYTYAWAPGGQTNATATGLSAGTYTITVTDANSCTVTATAVVGSTAGETVSINSVTNVSCNGGNNGKITTNTVGGTLPYTYNWTPSGGTNSTASNLTAGTYTITVHDANGCVSTASATITQPAVLTVSTGSITNVKCNGGSTGSATATPGGGTSPYTYAWAPGGQTNATATGLSAGTYTVTVTDANSCTATATAVITQPAVALSVSTGSIVNVKCNGGSTGSATATPAGGTSPYTYAWAPGGQTNATATGLSAGTYTITVTDANSCTATATAVITQPAVLTVGTSTTPAACGSSNGTATATPGGGTSPYTYAWAPGGQTNATATGLSAGTYTITVTDANSCTATATATVSNTGGETVSINTVTNVSCNGGNNGKITTNTAGGTVPYTYNWTPSGGTNSTASNLTAGTYTITVHDASGCVSTASATVTQPPVLTVNINPIVNVKCNGGSTGDATANAGGGTGAYTYAWAPGGQTNATATGLSAATYTVTVTDANSCTVTASATITQPTALTVSTGSITNVKCNGGSNGSATATPGGGTSPYTYSWAPGGQTNATATGLSAGTYTITVTDANSCTATATAVITQPATLTVSTGSIINVKCNGGSTGSATATPGGGTSPYTYAWAPGGQTNATATGLSAGTYTVTVTDANSCTATATAIITQPATLTVTTSTTPTSCGGSTGTATATPGGGTSPYTYAWAPGGQTNATATGLSAGTYTITVTDANSCTATATAVVTNTGGETVSINTVTNVSCNGGNNGKITTNTVGGTLPYTYNWTPSGGTNSTASNLTAGTYTITVHDANGCVSTASATVTQPPVLTVNINPIVNVKCNGGSTGSLTANGGGGTGAYTYAWAPGGQTNATATGLSAGTYTVTVTDANSCSATASATITQPPVLTVSTTTVAASCGSSNGSATANPSGGTGAYTYAWAPGGQTNQTATGLSAATYTVTVTDANSCTATATATVSNTGAETVSINTVTNVSCNGGNNGKITTNTVGGTLPYTYNWTPSGGTNSTASNLTAGTYTITVHDANGCVSTASATVTQPPVLTVNINPIVNVKCNGGSTGSLTANPGGGTSPYTFAWAPGGQTNATATGLSAGTYTITVHDANNCSVTASATITQPVALTVTIGSVSNVSCFGGSDGSATANPAGGTSPYTYAWAPGGQTNATATGLSAGTYTVTVTDANSCNATASVTITQPPSMTVAPTNPTICSGGSVVLTASGATSYSWSPATGLSSTIVANPTASPTVTTTYTVTGTTGGCIQTLTVTVTVSPTPVITVIPPNPTICSGDSVVLTASGATSYTWAPPAGLSATNTTVVTAFPAATTTYTVTGSSNGCSATQTVHVTVNPTPTVAVAPPSATICSGNSVGLLASGAAAYNWTPAAGLSANNIPNPVASPAVTTSYTVTGSTGGCSNMATVLITVNPTPTVTIVPASATLCSGSGGVAITASGATTYSWAPAAGLSATNVANPLANPAVTTTYTVTGTTGTCTSTQMITITVNPTPTVTVIPANPGICSGSSVNLTASGATSYNWSPATGLSATNIANPVASPAVTTSYTVTGTTGGCSSTAIVTVNVTPVPTVSVNPTATTICSGSSVVLTASGSVATYNWAPSAGLSATSGSSVTATPAVTTTYTVLATSGACTDSAMVTITVNPTPTLTVTPNPASICAGSSVGLLASGATSYNWRPAAGLSATNIANPVASPAVTTTYTVTGTTGSCSDSQTVTVTVNSAPRITVNPSSATICTGGHGVTLTASGAATYAWAPPAGLSATSGVNVNANPTITTTYTVTGTNKSGCAGVDSVTITVDSGVVASITGNDTICRGDSTVLTASGGGTYSWNNGATTQSITVRPTSTTTYTVTATRLVCSGMATRTVVVDAPPAPLISQSGDTLKCTPNGYTYQWYRNGNPIAGSTSDTAIVHQTGNYKVRITDGRGCMDTALYNAKSILTVNMLSYDNFISIYPNPVNGTLHIDCSIPEGDYRLTLTDVLGQVLYTDKLHISGRYSGIINMDNYAPGMYILSIKGSNSITQKKIMVSK